LNYLFLQERIGINIYCSGFL